MFTPKYTISPRLLANIKRITTLILELNNKKISKVILLEMERKAREISAHTSTSIEGNPLPLTEVKKILKTRPEHIRNSEREVLNYNEALIQLNIGRKKKQKPFNFSFILHLHKLVTKGLISTSRCGKTRNDPVFVNDPRAGKTIYWPPDQQEVLILLNELLTYIQKNKTTFDPILLAGIFHKQFVIIHPFMDGNGRTVRLATKVLLANMGLDTFNLFSFENYYNKNVDDYFKNVGVRGNYYDIKKNINFTPWLEYFTDGIIDELLRVEKTMQQTTATPQTVLKPHDQTLLKYIKNHDFITDKIYSTLTDRAKPTRNLDFNKLIRLKLIERCGKGKATFYKLTDLL